jgi:superfamily II DNA/RNA helicase
MIATSRSRRRASLVEDGATPVGEAEEEQVVAEEVPSTKKRKLSTSSKLIIPKKSVSSKSNKTAGSDGGNAVADKNHPVIGAFLRQEHIESPLPLQKKCWPAVLRGENVYVIAQPGSGKTLSYLLPIACKLVDLGHSMTTRPLGPLALVLLPTRELAQQVAAVCRKIKKHCAVLRVSCLTGGSEKGKQFDSLKRKPHIVVATPGRCVDMLEDGALTFGSYFLLYVVYLFWGQ